MQVSEHSVSPLSTQSHEDSSCKRQRTKSPEKSCLAADQPPVVLCQDRGLLVESGDAFAPLVQPGDLSEYPTSLIEETNEALPSSKMPMSILRV
ncbi:hypothetical protein FisN_10Hu316 [Fistulifera solaris]|uniref:Uncharacterized protein n=1 Tax=Fistulifera solaris TaxID=1519565 RepID=A0A1Z5JWT2_FISSO|nr:hypothetical protein FisN_10Hu316 [Fistulifera solaris]|eukprot:GAX18487.1 hypothetical protein FisN_10Hu316 [Fistulifera solaris]